MLPVLFQNRMKEMLGEEFEAFLGGYEKENHQSLRLNPWKVRESADSALSLLMSKFDLKKVPWEPMGYYYAHTDRPGKDPLHDAGLYYIQEASAMLPVTLLEAKPGDYILDLCAAPGGKSTQIAGYLQGKGLLVCNEIHPQRAKILSENVERMGVVNALVTNMAPAELVPHFIGFFDRILVDAPCSGEGMFRKNEEAVDEWSEENVALCAQRQREILDCATKMLRPGGRLVYSTCTFAPAENEENMDWFLQTYPEFTAEPIPHAYYEMVHYEDRQDGRLRIYPHRVEGEGHFAAVFTKAGPSENPVRLTAVPMQKEKRAQKGGAKQNPMEDFDAFCKENLRHRPEELFENSGYHFFGDQLYLKPIGLPMLNGLKVLRPGLHLGTMKKNRFEPSHALALALQKEEVVHAYDLAGAEAAGSYLNGMTFSAEGDKGWYLICSDGYSLGWGKLAGNIMKNHYPRGLRNP